MHIASYFNNDNNDSKNSNYWTKFLIFLFIWAIIFYMYYGQTLLEQKYNSNWLSRNMAETQTTTAKNDAIEVLTKDNLNTNENLQTKKGESGKSTKGERDNNIKTMNIADGKVKDGKTVTTKVTADTTTTTVTQNEDLRTRNILQWSPGTNSPFCHMGRRNTNFIKLSCPYTNCYVTDNRSYLPNITQFDAIIFNGNFVIFKEKKDLPKYRSPTQMFVFGATESAHNNPVCKPVLDNFFNWTYTYKLDSDIRWSYILIYDKDGNEVGPRPDMIWPKEMDPIDEETKAILDGKTKTAAWFVSHCNTLSRREDFIRTLQSELGKIDSSMTVDVYGHCGKFTCPRTNTDRCYGLIKKDYYFYLSFENSFAMDYVTEKLLTALNNFAIPVVFGGADYTRYLPPGSYLNARELGVEKLASTMKEIMGNKTRYHGFFRWRNHFRYKQGENDTEICNLCTALNDPKKYRTTSTYENFRDWWYEDWKHHVKC